MSGWDQYITSLTSKGITHAGIFSHDGSRWAASASFPQFDKMKEELGKAFSNEPGGVFVKGDKYIFIKREGDFIILRKNTDGMVISKTNQAYIISIGVNQKPEMLVEATTKIGEYLKGLGY